MQLGQGQTPGTLQRQATSYGQRSLVITWPCHSYVNIHTGCHFAWKPVINDLNQRKMALHYVQYYCVENDKTYAVIKKSKDEQADSFVVLNASMTWLEENAAGLQLHHV